MKIELKNIKHFAQMSEETHCYNASLYVDRKYVCEVGNRGHGGCDEINPTKRSPANWQDIVKTANNYFAEQEIETEFGTLNNSLEIECGELVNKWLEKKEIKRICKTIAFVKPDTPKGSYFKVNMKPTDENIAKLRNRPDWDDSWKILNEMPIEMFRLYI